jgi:hypothetical protein
MPKPVWLVCPAWLARLACPAWLVPLRPLLPLPPRLLLPLLPRLLLLLQPLRLPLPRLLPQPPRRSNFSSAYGQKSQPSGWLFSFSGR